ncbi:MAG: tyrosine-type recombinase/integrase [Syntrophobacteraceae bacterium]
MGITDSIIGFRRSLKRRNYSRCTVRDYLSTLKQFVIWVDCPIEKVDRKKILSFIDYLLDKRLHPKTINCYLDSIRSFYKYLKEEEDIDIENPVRSGYLLRLPKPLPRFLRDEEVEKLLNVITGARDRAIFYLMLRCGLRVEETAGLMLDDLDLRRGTIIVKSGKGAKGRMVYMSTDAHSAIKDYLRVRKTGRTKALFLVDKGALKGKPISIRGIQKRLELYARKSGLKVSCHELRHTMATQLLNAGADLSVIQDLLGHSRVATTQRYCKVSNMRVQNDYYKAMDLVVKRTSPAKSDPAPSSP